jgi:hypothetical protein
MNADILAKIGVDTTGLSTGLSKAKGDVSSFAQTASQLKSQLAGMFSIGAIVGFTKSLANYGTELKSAADYTGFSTDQLQALELAAKKTGGSLNDVTGMLNRLKRAVAEAIAGKGELVKAFEALGLSQEDLKNKSTEEIFDELSRAFSEGKISGEQFAAMTKILGENLTTVEAIMKGVNGNIKDFTRLTKDDGSIISSEDVDNLAQWTEHWATIKTLGRGAFFNNDLMAALKFLGGSTADGADLDAKQQALYKMINSRNALNPFGGRSGVGLVAEAGISAMAYIQSKSSGDQYEDVKRAMMEDLEGKRGSLGSAAMINQAERRIKEIQEDLKNPIVTDSGRQWLEETLAEWTKIRDDLLNATANPDDVAKQQASEKQRLKNIADAEAELQKKFNELMQKSSEAQYQAYYNAFTVQQKILIAEQEIAKLREEEAAGWNSGNAKGRISAMEAQIKIVEKQNVLAKLQEQKTRDEEKVKADADRAKADKQRIEDEKQRVIEDFNNQIQNVSGGSGIEAANNLAKIGGFIGFQRDAKMEREVNLAKIAEESRDLQRKMAIALDKIAKRSNESGFAP